MKRSLTKRADAPQKDVVDLLVDCHERIRRFVALGAEIAARTDAPVHQIVEACDDVERYFRVALPLHVADEETSVLSRLRGRVAEVDAALSRMQGDHAGHAPKLDALFACLDAVRRAPGDASARATLGDTVRALHADFEEHLRLEETVIFPALRAHLTDDDRGAIVDELRARRGAGA